MNTQIKNEIIKLAHERPDVEICGYIYYTKDNKLSIYPGHNIAMNPSEEFEIDPVDYLQCSYWGTIVGVYHSHPDNTESFSEADLEYIQEIGVPLYLYTLGTGRWQEYIPPTYEVELVGLPFIWGLYDCYSIVRNGLRQRANIFLGDYDRDGSFAQDAKSKSLIINQFAAEDMEIVGRGQGDVGKLRRNDVILFNTPSVSRVLPVHFGLYDGDSMFIHHRERALSIIEQLDGDWMGRINLILRHKMLAS